MADTKITNHTDLRIALEDKTIRDITSRDSDYPGFSTITLHLSDGTAIDLDTVTRNGGSYITVDVR